MKIKTHLKNGDIIETNDNNIDKEKFIEGIKEAHGDYAAVEIDNRIIFLRNIMYFEFEE